MRTGNSRKPKESVLALASGSSAAGACTVKDGGGGIGLERNKHTFALLCT